MTGPLKDLDLMPLKYRFIFSDLLLFHQIFCKKSCIELPAYYIKYSEDERKRLRTVIKPPEYYGGGTQTMNLQKPRESKNSELSLKRTLSKTILSINHHSFFELFKNGTGFHLK